MFPFKELENFPGNPLNENQPISKSFNGQELPYNIGNYLSYQMLREGLEMFDDVDLNALDMDDKSSMISSPNKMKESKQQYKPQYEANDKFKRVVLIAPEKLEPVGDYESESAQSGTGDSDYGFRGGRKMDNMQNRMQPWMGGGHQDVRGGMQGQRRSYN